ncbi:MAG: hemerythrin domain-containing protein, partial [Sporomusaceae bacterium]|nr:hemerythrin domain-containing protein [Sporomusaceae bacterium]
LEALLDEVLVFLKNHFFHEEKFMLHHKYPSYSLHKKAHKNLFEQVQNYKNQMNVNNPFICNQILQLLRDSITPHIYSLDKGYAQFIAKSMKTKYASKESS